MCSAINQPALNIVVVEDHDSLRWLIVQALTETGHAARGLGSAEELQDFADHGAVDIFLLDLNLPGEDGLQLSKRLRAAFPLVGIIMVTARAESDDRVLGYEHGADLYLSKPFEVKELLAAVAALGRRKSLEQSSAQGPGAGHYMLNYRNMLFVGPDNLRSVSLTAAEVQLLVALVRAPAQRLDTWQLIESLGLAIDSNARGNLEVRLTRLRKKLVEQVGAPKNCLESIRREGYQLCISLQVL